MRIGIYFPGNKAAGTEVPPVQTAKIAKYGACVELITIKPNVKLIAFHRGKMFTEVNQNKRVFSETFTLAGKVKLYP
jgi:hypothetical protein